MRYRHVQAAENRPFPLGVVAVGFLVALVPLSYWAGNYVARGPQRASETQEDTSAAGATEEGTATDTEKGSSEPSSEAPMDEATPKVEIEFEEAAGYVAEKKGLLELRPAGEARWQPGDLGAGVFGGYGVRVDRDSSALLRLQDGVHLDLSGGANLELQPEGVELTEGTLRVDMASAKQAFTLTTAAGEITGNNLHCTVSVSLFNDEVEVTVHEGRAILRNEAGEVTLGPGVQARTRSSQPSVVAGARPAGAFEQTFTGRVLEVEGRTLRLQTEGGVIVTFRGGAEERGGVWQVARVGQNLRSLQVGDPVVIKSWSSGNEEWLVAIEKRPRPKPVTKEQEPLPLSGEGQVTGLVTGATGQPVAGIEVELHDAEGLLGRARTDARGQFRLASVPAGTYLLKALARDGRSGLSTEIQVLPNQIVAVPLTLSADSSLPRPPQDEGASGKEEGPP